MERRRFLKYAAGGAVALTMSRLEMAETGQSGSERGEGRVIEGFYPGNIVQLKDGSLLTDKWEHSTDGGKTWTKLKAPIKRGAVGGMIRLPNQELGYFTEHGWSLETALGNGSNEYLFYRSADEGRTWSEPVVVTQPGASMGLDGAIFSNRSGRVFIVTYSQFLPRMALWGASWGTYKGVRVKTESEGHFAEMEAVRVYHSSDNGKNWKPNNAWIIGWHDKKYTDSFVEATGVQLRDGHLLIMGRTLTGRLFHTTSSDQGENWSYATPTELVSSDSPPFLAKFPKSGDLLIVWNEISREENRRGFRRSRLESAVSKDDGRTWEHFKTLEHGGVPAVGRIPPSPDLSPVWGDDEVGELPDDYALFHYPSINFVGNDVYVSYLTYYYALGKNAEGLPEMKGKSGTRTRVLPTEWFYT